MIEKYFSIDWSILPAILSLVVSFLGNFMKKEDKFIDNTSDLNKKFLDKKVAALSFLIDSIEFTPTSLGEVKDFKGKRFFVDLEKYSLLERSVILSSKKYRIIINLFYYGLVLSVFLTLLSFIKIQYIKTIIIIISLLLTILVCTCVVYLRRLENKINKLKELDDLKHNE